MTINVTGPTAAITAGGLTAATYTFVADMATDLRSKAFVVSAIGGTQTGVNTHTVDAPKQFIVKKPAVNQQASGYNVTTGRYARVPKNVTRIIGRGSANVAAGQVEIIPITMDIPIPAGAMTYDRPNVEASVLLFIAALYDQKEEIITALRDGLY